MATLHLFVPLGPEQEIEWDAVMPLLRASAAKKGVTLPEHPSFKMRRDVTDDGIEGMRLDYETGAPCPAT